MARSNYLVEGSTEFGERFLALPDLFPARSAGSRAGSEALTLEFVGGPYAFVGLSEAQVEKARSWFGHLQSPSTVAAAVTTQVYAVPDSDFLDVGSDLKEYAFDIDYSAGGLRAAGWKFMARIELSPLCGSVFVPEAADDLFLGTFANYFRLLTSYRLLELGGLLLHSAGVASGDKAHLFFGPSGAGKTTLSRLSQSTGRSVLSDDLNAIAWLDGEPVVERVPFAGALGRFLEGPSRAKLSGLYRLRQAPQHQIWPLSQARAIALLCASAPFVNHDPFRVGTLLDTVEQLTTHCPVQTLGFARDPGFWSLISERA